MISSKLKWIIIGTLSIAAGLTIGIVGVHENWLSKVTGSGGDSSSSDTSSSDSAGDGEVQTIPTVKVAAISEGSLNRRIEMLGTVTNRASANQSQTLNSEVVIRNVLVTPGSTVNADDAIIEVEESPAAKAALANAQSAVQLATQSLNEANNRLKLKVGTKPEVIQAQQALASANLQLNQLLERRPPSDGMVRTRTSGILSMIDIKVGQIVAPGTDLFEITPPSARVIQFGIPAEDASLFNAGDQITIVPAVESAPNDTETAKPLTTTITRIDPIVDPATQLHIGVVNLDPTSAYLAGTQVKVVGMKPLAKGLVAPRGAVCLDESGAYVFTVDSKDIAHRHQVTVMGSDEKSEQIKSEDNSLHAGDKVVTLGGAELEEGMTVKPEGQP